MAFWVNSFGIVLLPSTILVSHTMAACLAIKIIIIIK